MAFTVLAALFAAMILSVTFVPAGVALFVTGRVSEKESVVVTWAERLYLPALRTAMSNRIATVTVAVALMFVTGAMAMRLGSEFLPSLDEGDLLVHALCDWCAIDVVEDGRIRRVGVAHVDPAKRGTLAEFAARFPARWDSTGPGGQVPRRGEAGPYRVSMIGLAANDTLRYVIRIK